jgi:antirestriction protein ArdC
MLKYYNVFNYEQTEGIKLKEVVLPNESAEPIELCENVVSDYTKRCKLKQLVIGASDRAYYSPSKDLVNMPMLEQFKSTEEYYSVMFHELAHSTGHESRLKRKEVVQGGVFGSTDYGLEELVAELTASFVSAEVGISNESTERNSQAYLKGWYEAIAGDRKMFITASARASKSADLILNRLEVVTQED